MSSHDQEGGMGGNEEKHHETHGSAFGHIEPGVFLIGMAMIMAFFRERHINRIAFLLLGMSVTGVVIEMIGGMITFQNPFFQVDHIIMFGFFSVSAIAMVCVPQQWEDFFGLAFVNEGFVFLGHALQQSNEEFWLHLVLVILAWSTAFFYFWRMYVYAESGMFAQGLFFFVITYDVFIRPGDHEHAFTKAGGIVFITAIFFTLPRLVAEKRRLLAQVEVSTQTTTKINTDKSFGAGVPKV